MKVVFGPLNIVESPAGWIELGQLGRQIEIAEFITCLLYFEIGEEADESCGQLACACRKLNPGILLMQPAQDWATKNVPSAIDGARERRILLQGEMSARAM